MVEPRSSASESTLGDRINRLVATTHPPDRGPYTDEEIVTGIREAGGPSLSVQYFNHLRRGRRDNPTRSTIEGIVRFFRVPIGYLFSDEFSRTSEDDHVVLAAVRKAELESIVVQISELPPETRESLARIVEDLHRLHVDTRRSRRS